MMGYGDRTWCPERISDLCAQSRGCYRVFTPEDRKNAIKWWGGEDFPIAQFTGEPSCFIPIQIVPSDGGK